MKWLSHFLEILIVRVLFFPGQRERANISGSAGSVLEIFSFQKEKQIVDLWQPIFINRQSLHLFLPFSGICFG